MAFKLKDDHWAFLDEIEAPMWVDLSLESNSKAQNSDEMWFYTTHQFHQCSSSHLKSVFSRSGGSEITTAVDSGLLGSSSSSSPKLPDSVSKSRGKEYRSEKWKWDNKGVPFDKSHPVEVLTGKSSCRVNRELGSIRLNEASTSSGRAVSNFSKPQSSSSENRNTSESIPTSGVTSESGQERTKVELGQTSELLLMMRKSVRKSYITRQAIRVETKGWNSTSSKSSVGSSSNPRCNAKISDSLPAPPKEITPESRNVARISPVPKSSMSSSSAVKARPTLKSEEGASDNRRELKQVKFCNTRAKASVSTGFGNRALTVASTQLEKKPGTSMRKKLVSDGKENNVGEKTSSQKTLASTKLEKKPGMSVRKKFVSDGKENNMGKRTLLVQKKCSVSGIVAGGESIGGRDRKVMTQSLSKGKGKVRGNLEKPKSFVQRVHFR